MSMFWHNLLSHQALSTESLRCFYPHALTIRRIRLFISDLICDSNSESKCEGNCLPSLFFSLFFFNTLTNSILSHFPFHPAFRRKSYKITLISTSSIYFPAALSAQQSPLFFLTFIRFFLTFIRLPLAFIRFPLSIHTFRLKIAYVILSLPSSVHCRGSKCPQQ